MSQKDYHMTKLPTRYSSNGTVVFFNTSELCTCVHKLDLCTKVFCQIIIYLGYILGKPCSDDRAGKCEFDLELSEKVLEHLPTLSTDLAIPFDHGPRAGASLDLIARPTLDHLGWLVWILEHGWHCLRLLWNGTKVGGVGGEGENCWRVFVAVLFTSVAIPCPWYWEGVNI